MGSRATRATEDRRLRRIVQDGGHGIQFVVRRADPRARRREPQLGAGDQGLAQSDVAGKNDDGYAASRDRRLHRGLEDARHLLWLRDQLAVVAALLEEMFRVGLLEVPAPQLRARNLGGDGDHGNPVALAIVEAVDQMQVAGSAASCANRQPSRQVGFRPGGKCRHLLVPHVDPIEPSSGSDGVRNTVEGVAGNTVDPLNPGFSENVHEQLRHRFPCHAKAFLTFPSA